MHEFTPFKKTDKLSFESFIRFPRELLKNEEYKNLSPNAMLLYSIMTDRLDLSFKQIVENKKIQFYDAKGDMYVIFKREEIQKLFHIKRSALDTAILQLYDEFKEDYKKDIEWKEKSKELIIAEKKKKSRNR